MTAEPTQGRRRVVIACQGGGSHTAFTAGVLRRLLDGPEIDEYDVVGLSGTSGGAVCALLAWTALRDGDRHKARALLDGFWADNAASTPTDVAANAWMMWAATLQSAGWLPSVSPYDLPVDGLGQFRDLLKRRVDFDAITVDPEGPLLLVGAVDVLSGRFRAFHSYHEQITADMILASAAIPNVFPAVHTDGGTFWDGLFSQNPPVRELLDATPDELWVIQINPTARGRGAQDGAGHHRPPQRAGGQPLALPGAARHRGDRPVARRRNAGRQPVPADHGAGVGVRAPGVIAAARADVQAQPRRPVPARADGAG